MILKFQFSILLTFFFSSLINTRALLNCVCNYSTADPGVGAGGQGIIG